MNATPFAARVGILPTDHFLKESEVTEITPFVAIIVRLAFTAIHITYQKELF